MRAPAIRRGERIDNFDVALLSEHSNVVGLHDLAKSIGKPLRASDRTDTTPMSHGCAPTYDEILF